MTWVRHDDGYDESEKVEEAWELEPASIGLHVMATTCCARRSTDGVIPPRWLRTKLGPLAHSDKVLQALVDTGLFDVLPAGSTKVVQPRRGPEVTIGPFRQDRYLVHDYLDHNDSAAFLQQRRAKDAERKAVGGSARPSRTDSARNPNGVADGIGPDSGSPDPTRPDPTEPPQSPPPGGADDEGKVVTFARRPVPRKRLEVAERLLTDFNERAGTSHGAYTGRGEASESLRRIIGALTDHPSVDEQQWQAAIKWRLENPFWDGKPDTGVVFGPRTVSANLASSMQGNGRGTPDSLRSKIIGAGA